MNASEVVYTHFDSPLGKMMAAWNDDGVVSIRFRPLFDRAEMPPDWRFQANAHSDVTEQLRAYFARELRGFDLRVAQEGTPFQRQVWDAVAEIPYGETRSYGEVARAISRPKAVRAVGAANGRNDVPIVIPCHRVIGGGGELRGYAGGVDIKERLLSFERGGGWSDRDLFGAPRLARTRSV